MLAIPNTEILNTTVASYTNFPHLRIDIDVTVGVDEDLERARKVLLGLVENDERFLREPAPEVVVVALNDYNTALQLRVWLDDERDHVARRLELRERAFLSLQSAGIDMPFETIQIAPVTVVAEDDWTSEVVAKPVRIPLHRLLVMPASALRILSQRTVTRNGVVISFRKARKKVARMTKNDETNANPAPGPM